MQHSQIVDSHAHSGFILNSDEVSNNSRRIACRTHAKLHSNHPVIHALDFPVGLSDSLTSSEIHYQNPHERKPYRLPILCACS